MTNRKATSRPINQGDIVLLEFPFSDLSEKKLRPAVVLSNKTYNKHSNLILAGVYGKKKPFAVHLSNASLTRKRLKKESWISLQNIFSAERVLLGHVIDSLEPKALSLVLQKVGECF